MLDLILGIIIGGIIGWTVPQPAWSVPYVNKIVEFVKNLPALIKDKTAK